MSLWTMIFLIVMPGIIFAAWKHHHDLRMGIVRDEDGNPVRNALHDTELEREVAELRERVKVLERIATEEREANRLSSEIEQLRDK